MRVRTRWLVGLQFRLAFASGLGTAGRGKKLVVLTVKSLVAVEKIAKKSFCVDVSDLQGQTFLYVQVDWGR